MLPDRFHLASIFLVIAACAPETQEMSWNTSGPEDVTDDDDDAVPDIDDCVVDDSAFSQISTSPTQVGTVLDVHWRSHSSGTTAMVFVDSNGDQHTVNASSQGDIWNAQIRGVRPWTDVEYLIETVTPDGALLCSTPQTATTGGLPSGLPELTVSNHEPEQSAGGWILTTVVTPSAAFPAVLDSQGRYVWAISVGIGAQRSVTRTTMAADGNGIVYNIHDSSAAEDGRISHVSWAGDMQSEVHTVVGVDFVVLPDGSYASLSWEWGDFTGPEGEAQTWRGDTIELIDPKTDSKRTLWHIFDDFDPEDERIARSAKEELNDLGHVNSISYDPSSGDFFISIYVFGSVARIDGDSGTMEWLLNGDSEFQLPSDFAIAAGNSPDDLLSFPHSTHFLGDSILVFNLGTPAGEGKCSSVVEIAIDTEYWMADVDWSWESDECMQVIFLGEADRLHNGNTQVVWSSLGQIDEATEQGTSILRVNTDLGAAFGFAERPGSLYGEQP